MIRDQVVRRVAVVIEAVDARRRLRQQTVPVLIRVQLQIRMRQTGGDAHIAEGRRRQRRLEVRLKRALLKGCLDLHLRREAIERVEVVLFERTRQRAYRANEVMPVADLMSFGCKKYTIQIVVANVRRK